MPETYEAAYEELEGIYQAITNDAVSVDELAVKVKPAAQLVPFCRAKLKSTEEEIGKIVAIFCRNDEQASYSFSQKSRFRHSNLVGIRRDLLTQ